MPVTIKFQDSHSRNAGDWKLTKSSTGRYVLQADEKGVSLRVGLLVDYLHKNGRSTKKVLVAHLKTFHRSYNANDVSQPIKQMIAAGIVQTSGLSRRSMRYSLTPNGTRLWAAAKRKWV